MTTPVEPILEPFAVSFVTDPANPGDHVMTVDQGKTSPESPTIATLPIAMITMTGTQTNLKNAQIRIFGADSTRRITHLVGTDKQMPMLQFSIKPGEYIAVWGANQEVGVKGELLLTVIPLPFSK